MEFVFHLKEAREKKGWTQRRLAASSGISQAHICDIENGRSRPSLDTAERLADALGERLDRMTGVKWTLTEALGPFLDGAHGRLIAVVE